MRSYGFLAILLSVGLFVACGKTSSTMPSDATPSAATGATISGSILGGGSSSTTSSSTGGGLTVTVVGTSITAAVDGSNHFTLTGIPGGGDVQLRFRGASTDATVTVSAVGTTDNFTITVTVNGTSATLNSDSRHGNQGGNGNPNEPQQQIEGIITAIPPTTPAASFTVAGQTVQTNASTVFVQDDTPKKFTDLKVGLRVHVKGNPTATGFLATRVELQVGDNDNEAEVSGKIVSRTGTAPNLTLVVGTTTIHTNASTAFGHSGGDDVVASGDDKNKTTTFDFTSLQVGVAIDVEGVRQADGSILATKISREDDN